MSKWVVVAGIIHKTETAGFWANHSLMAVGRGGAHHLFTKPIHLLLILVFCLAVQTRQTNLVNKQEKETQFTIDIAEAYGS